MNRVHGVYVYAIGQLPYSLLPTVVASTDSITFGAQLSDGHYKYELVAVPEQDKGAWAAAGRSADIGA